MRTIARVLLIIETLIIILGVTALLVPGVDLFGMRFDNGNNQPKDQSRIIPSNRFPSAEDHLAGPQRSVTELCVWIGIRTVCKFNEWKSLILVGGGAGLKTRSCGL